MIAALAADIGRCKLGPADSKLASAAAAVRVAVETSAVGQGELLLAWVDADLAPKCVLKLHIVLLVPYRSSDAHSTKSTHPFSFLRTNLLGVSMHHMHCTSRDMPSAFRGI